MDAAVAEARRALGDQREREKERVTDSLDALKRLVGDPRLSDSERAFARYRLSLFSKELDALEQI